MTGHFSPDYEGIGEMLNSDFMLFEMKRRADLGQVYATTVAPVDVDGPHPGQYRASFDSSSGKHGGFEHDRAYGRLENIAEYALWVEVGTRDTPAHHVLARALDIMAAG